MSEDTLDISDSTAEFKITVSVRKVLNGIRVWALFSAIIGFLLSLCGLLFIGFVYVENSSRTYYSDDFFFGILLFGASTLVVFLLSKFLFDYSRNLRKSIRQNSEIHLEKAFRGLRNALIVSSILWFILLGFSVFAIVIITMLSRYF